MAPHTGADACARGAMCALGNDGAAAAPHTGVDVCARGAMYVLGDEEQLWRPTPELTYVLGELMFALGDAGATSATHIGAAIHSQRCDCCIHLGIWELLWRPHTGAVAHAI